MKKESTFSNHAFAAACARDKISCRAGTRVFAVAACTLGKNVNDMKQISKSTMHRLAQQAYQEIAENIKNTFDPPQALYNPYRWQNYDRQ